MKRYLLIPIAFSHVFVRGGGDWQKRHIGAYLSVLGLTYQSSRLKASMSENLVKMTTEAAKAAQHQEAAKSDFALSTQEHDKAIDDETKGETLQEEADALFVKADQDEAMAATEETVADGQAAKAVGEEKEAGEHFAEAGSLQAAVDADRIDAGVESAAAARTEFTAHGDELGTGICEFVPVLDVVCDILGGTAAVGLEASAAKEAAESAAFLAAAVEGESKEKAEMALAVEFQGEATKDGELATEGHAEAAELEAEADAELTEAQEEETAAQEILDQSALEEETAREEQGEAMEEEAQSDASFAKSVEHGVAACYYACIAVAVSLSAVGFFALRFATMMVSSASTHLPSIVSNGTGGLPLKWVSQLSLHCIIFCLTLRYFGSSFFEHLDSLQVRARGGIILLFSMSIAVAQALFVHSLPMIWSTDGDYVGRIKASSRAFLSSVARLFPLIILEFLILRVLFGATLFSANILNNFQQWYLWAAFVVSLVSYYWFFERRKPEIQSMNVMSGGYDVSSYGATTERSVTSCPEAVPLASSTAVDEQETTMHSRFTAIARYLEQYQLPFDLLVAVCAFAVLRVCFPNMRRLWPLSKTIILAAHPHWWVVAVVCSSVLLLGTSVFCLCRRKDAESYR